MPGLKSAMQPLQGEPSWWSCWKQIANFALLYTSTTSKLVKNFVVNVTSYNQVVAYTGSNGLDQPIGTAKEKPATDRQTDFCVNSATPEHLHVAQKSMSQRRSSWLNNERNSVLYHPNSLGRICFISTPLLLMYLCWTQSALNFVCLA